MVRQITEDKYDNSHEGNRQIKKHEALSASRLWSCTSPKGCLPCAYLLWSLMNRDRVYRPVSPPPVFSFISCFITHVFFITLSINLFLCITTHIFCLGWMSFIQSLCYEGKIGDIWLCTRCAYKDFIKTPWEDFFKTCKLRVLHIHEGS